MAWSDTASILNDARVTRQELGNALSSGLAELRGSLEQIRQELLESGNATFSTLRDENRELRNRLNKTTSELAEVRQEIARTRTDIAALRSHLAGPARTAPTAPTAPGSDGALAVAAVPAPAELSAPPEGAVELPAQRQPSEAARPVALQQATQEPEPAVATEEVGGGEQGPERPRRPSVPSDSHDGGTGSEDVEEGLSHRRHAGLLMAAAGISSATVVCHRDTFAFLVQQSVGDPHFHVPGKAEDAGEGRVQVSLSGRSLIAALTSLWRSRAAEEKETTGNWALAVTLYLRIAGAIEGATHKQLGSGPVDITLDDRSAAPEDDTSETPAA